MKKLWVVFLFIFSFINVAHCQNIDIDILKGINLNRPRSLDNTFLTITKTAKPLAVAAPIAMFVVGIANKDDSLKYEAIQMAGGLVITSLITEGLKYSIHRRRPYITYPYIENVTSPKDPPFPSGHTSVSFYTATYLSLKYKKWYVIAPSFLWATTIAYSRIDLGVHYPSDVIGGALIGVGSAWIAYRLQKWMNRRPENLLNSRILR